MISCPDCSKPVDKIEVCDEVATTYVWNAEENDWVESDTDYCGEVTVTYYCPECKADFNEAGELV